MRFLNGRALSHSPYLDQYVRTPNRLAFGERTVIVMSSKVAQKSYGTEKRCVLVRLALSVAEAAEILTCLCDAPPVSSARRRLRS